MKLKLIIAIVFTAMLSSCALSHEIRKAKTLGMCEYKFTSISDIRVSDIKIEKGINVVDLMRLKSFMNPETKELPISFTVNLDVYNPNEIEGGIHEAVYTIYIDGIEFAKGKSMTPFSVMPKEHANMPISLNIDIKELMNENTSEAANNLLMNIIGFGKKESEIKIDLKPKMIINNKSIPVGNIPIKFKIGENRE